MSEFIAAANRVVVTGVGIVSSLGNDGETFFDALYMGRTAVSRKEYPHLCSPVAGAQFDSTKHYSKIELLGLDRGSQFAMFAADCAIQSSGIDREELPKAAVFWGTGGGGFESLELAYQRMYGGRTSTSIGLSSIIPAAMVHAPAAQISIRYGIRGECLTYSTACSSASIAFGEAWGRVRSGMRDVAIVGGSECPLVPGVVAGWQNMRVLSQDDDDGQAWCRPFSKGRQGFCLGEGAASFVLESLEHAKRRGANILAEVVGYGVSNDGSHITRPNVRGQEVAIRNAIESAGISSNDIGYVNAHGTGTNAGDAAECASMGLVFCNESKRPLVSSTKAAHGHTLGASGAIELVAVVHALLRQKVPPTINWIEADKDTQGWDFVANLGRPAQLEYAMSNSFAFGGCNAVIIMRKSQN
ncbi:beta-ketoacyl-[acyl-carrier-protein] synthase family protein [Pandoraea sp. NPDC090278]|uniref:beta-ketoacyl-[acyl-carrier-protein] synthase family protein n=1 Tax=Pandoraea sp. NPDC090278 TaxID=3364391 RepID=UPI00383A33BF